MKHNVCELNCRKWQRHLPGHGHNLATMGQVVLGGSRFELFETGPTKKSASHRWGAQSVWLLITDYWLPTLWKSGGRRHQMCGRSRGAKGLSLPSQKQCLNLAVMHFCLIDCFDAVFFPSSFCFEGALMSPSLPSVDEENLVGFQLHSARTFRRFFDGKKSHWRSQGPHWPPFMYRHHSTLFLIPDKKWVRWESNLCIA